MENWQMALVVLAAVAAGATIPVLVQLRSTLRALERTLETAGARLDSALAATIGTAQKVDALVARVEEGGRIEQLVDGITAVTSMAKELRNTVRIASSFGAAVAPAVSAAVHALRDDRDAPAITPPPDAALGTRGEP